MARKSNTRNASGSGTIRQRSPERWEGRYTIGRDPGTGKQIQKSVYGKTEQEVAKKLRKATTSIDEGTYSEPAKLTVGQWLDIWLKEYTGDLKPRTLDQYDMHVRLNIKPSIGALQLSTLSAHTIQKLYNDLQRREKPLSAKSVRNLHGVLHSALEKALSLGYLKFNPSNACTLPRVVKQEMRTITDAGLDAFLLAIQGHQFEPVYTLDLFTGMRQGEILGLQWACVDTKEGVIIVNKQLQKERGKGGKHVFAPLKNDKERRIKIPPFLVALLIEQKRKQKEWKLRAGGAWDNNMGLVFTNELGRYLSAVTVYNNFKRIVEGLGLDALRFHDMRHSAATLMLQNGDDIKTVQQALGHATAAFTLSVYAHVSERMQNESANRMEAFYKGLTQNKTQGE